MLLAPLIYTDIHLKAKYLSVSISESFRNKRNFWKNVLIAGYVSRRQWTSHK